MPYDGDVSMEDLIAVEDVVVTITRTGYAKRTKTDLYRAQRRGGKGVQGAALKQDDIVAHFFVCSTHDWILFFTNKGRVYRAKAYELPEANRNARGQHVANLLAFQPDEKIAQVIQIRNYEVAPYLVLATKGGLVKKSELTAFDSNRSGGIVAINLRDDDELVGAVLCGVRRGPAADLGGGPVDPLPRHRRGAAADGPGDLRGARACGSTPATSCCRWTSCTTGAQVLVATERGYAKRTDIEEYPVQGRGGKGVLTIQYDRRRGKLVGALIVELDTEVYAITSSGGVIRTLAREVRKAKRQTMGVRLMNLSEGDSLVAIARNADADPVEDGRRLPVRPPDGAVVTAAPVRLTGCRRDGTVRARVVTTSSAPGSGPGAGPVLRRRVADGAMAAPQHVGPARRRGRSAPSGPPPRPGSENARRAKAPRRPPRLASLQLKRVDPWTVLKISLIVAIVMFFVWMIAIGILYLTLGAMDVWTKINDTFSTLTSSPDAAAAGQTDLITAGRVFGVTAIVGAINIVLFTALATVAAFIYNAAAAMSGGVELTLGERD